MQDFSTTSATASSRPPSCEQVRRTSRAQMRPIMRAVENFVRGKQVVFRHDGGGQRVPPEILAKCARGSVVSPSFVLQTGATRAREARKFAGDAPVRPVGGPHVRADARGGVIRNTLPNSSCGNAGIPVRGTDWRAICRKRSARRRTSATRFALQGPEFKPPSPRSDEGRRARIACDADLVQAGHKAADIATSSYRPAARRRGGLV